jgi:2-amino-4-hydroxy-6-hydroxymethyldihydropteridine diphosphokinase
VILIGLGANLPHPVHGEPVDTLAVAIECICEFASLRRQSGWYQTAPVPVSDQPWFVNAVICVETDLSAPALEARLHKVEHAFGRVRREKWEARLLDLDLLDFHGEVTENRNQGAGLVLPHPQIEFRAFVLAPIAEIAPEWRHPVSGRAADDLLQGQASAQPIRRL